MIITNSVLQSKSESMYQSSPVQSIVQSSPQSRFCSYPARNAPWIGEFEKEDGEAMFFIFLEQKVLCTVSGKVSPHSG